VNIRNPFSFDTFLRVGFRGRNVSKRQSFHRFLDHIKKALNKQRDNKQYDNDGRAYYDYRNGIYY
jgi:hypothetical protein